METLAEMLSANRGHVAAFRDRFGEVQDAQHPEAVTVSCSDSRVLQDSVWGNDRPGWLFTCSNIGNRVVQRTESGLAVSGDVLYPVEHTGTETVVVMGHTGCGAVTATYDDLTVGLAEPRGIEHCIALLAPCLEPGVEALPDHVGRVEAVNRLVEYNVDRQVEFLRDSTDVAEAVTIAGAVYDFQDIYPGERGEIYVTNVDGETRVETLRETYPEVASRVARLWEY